ncbi:PPC domain-containing DNA-binding protein [Fimbriiglobus ruber]|uniref:PPC domain-containing protein n=1 Tax=Fimbriiglobus ruber TaxID=1908690 RepID=A0A225DQC6_9BACT|nr:PPC domain-containing DNA-binding protein [Fimbriiglobus ruber]OWK43293.1 hypothetical protein FRUB_02892 [Fimbriiglobus ruber]
MKTHAFRLSPGQDLKRELVAFAQRAKIRAGVVLTCVGSLKTTVLRYANRSETATRDGHFEIVSLVGTLAHDGAHLHLCATDGDGTAFGGHLADGCVIYTTAEVVVGELDGWVFAREPDAATGFRELVVRPRVDEVGSRGG